MFDKEYLRKIREEKEKWEAKCGSAKERDAKLVTDSDIPIRCLYTPLDVKSDYLENIGFPRVTPYTRGVYPTMYRGRVSYNNYV
jgi:methylmalonyl-CoA mutase N-terminal domain/subunit